MPKDNRIPLNDWTIERAERFARDLAKSDNQKLQDIGVKLCKLKDESLITACYAIQEILNLSF